MSENPIKRELSKQDYFSKFYTTYVPPISNSSNSVYGKWTGGYITLPIGISGFELLSLRKSLSAEYRLIEKGTGELEIIKRGANEGY